MTPLPLSARRALVSVCAVTASLVAAAPATARDAPTLYWQACGDAGAECATVEVPRDYSRPRGPTLDLAVTRVKATDPSRRIGSLFFNFGGPGGPAAEYVEAFGADLFATLSDRFDIVGMDPRGVGQSEPSIDCRVNQEAEGVYAQPFETFENLNVNAWVSRDVSYIRKCLARNHGILPYATTANVARDLDLVREAVGDRRLNYLGFSYGTFLGTTYASLFPNRYRALVLDGALDADQYINRPLENLREQSAGFEVALGRFFQACAVEQDKCRFGGSDPWQAFDELVERMYQQPLPAIGYAPDPRPVDGDDALAAAVQSTYSKVAWAALAAALDLAEAGDGSGIRELVNGFYGRLDDGTYDPFIDRYFTLSALEQRYPRDVRTYFDAGRHSWGLFEHAWWNAGYVELAWGLYPVRPVGAYAGPFRASRSAPTPLVIGTTYDPATPYRGSKRLVADLGNARLLTMRGDGHTAYGGNSACIDTAVDAYLEEGTLPPERTTCRQAVAAFPDQQALELPAPGSRRALRPHVKPMLP